MNLRVLTAAFLGVFLFAGAAQAAIIGQQTDSSSNNSRSASNPYPLPVLNGTLKAFDIYVSMSGCRWPNYDLCDLSKAAALKVIIDGSVNYFDAATYSIPTNAPGNGSGEPAPLLIHFVWDTLQSAFPIFNGAGSNTITFDTADSSHTDTNRIIGTKDDGAGNIYFVGYDALGEKPIITNVSAASTNASTTLAKVGDSVVLTFTADTIDSPMYTPSVTIGTHTGVSVATTSTAGSAVTYQASTTLDVSDTDGAAVTFSISVSNKYGDASFLTSTTSNNSSVTFDKTAPAITVTSGPAQGGYASSTPVVFAWTVDDASAAVTCSFNDAATSTCAGTATSTALAEGNSSFFVIASDAAGNTSATTTRTFTVDTVAPALTIDSGPTAGSATSTNSVSFAFTAGATSTCAFDGAGTTTPCSSPQAFGALADGSHTFYVSATDDAGNSASSTTSFSVDTTAPTLAEVTAIGTTTDTTPNYTFSSTEVGTTTYGGACSSTADTAAIGNNTVTLGALAVGMYSTCTVTVTDAVGNSSAPLAVSLFEIAATPTPPAPGNSGGGNGPPQQSPSQGLPQGVVLGTQTKAEENAAPKAIEVLQNIQPPAAPKNNPAASKKPVSTNTAPVAAPATALDTSNTFIPVAHASEQGAAIATAPAAKGKNPLLWVGLGGLVVVLAWGGKKLLA